MRFVLVASLFSLSLSAQAVTLSCDLSQSQGSSLTEPMYSTPVQFQQRQVTALLITLGSISWGIPPTIEKVTVVYDRREARSLETRKAFEEIPVGKRLEGKIDVPFFADYTSSEVRLSWNPEARVEWSENGTYRATVPGWQLFVEASDPYHQESYEASLNCSPVPR